MNGALLTSYIGRLVRLVGKVVAANDSIFDLEASDGARIQVRRTSSSANVGQVVEVVGLVVDATNIDESNSYEWSGNTGTT